ncbi:WG repeat-containing protein [Chryseobacterium sp. c4a]|uniref:WG repeat-containing protein n=1 Tax=Chryseobacterium sp. c4a TaxID=1573582 RepID=UPI00135CF019|nr:WG repeat-containing protein [Chryseobacterium sp. c4a]
MKSIIFLLLPCFIFTQKPTLFPLKKGDKWGYGDKNNKFVIAPQYDFAYPFSEYKVYDPQLKKYSNQMSAKVQLSDKTKCILENNTEISCSKLEDPSFTDDESTFISATEEEIKEMRRKSDNAEQNIINQTPEILKNTYKKVNVLSTSPLLFLVEKDNKKGVVNNTGNTVVPIEYDYIQPHAYQNPSGSYETYMVAGLYSINSNMLDKYYSKDGKIFLESYYPYSPADLSGKFIKIADKDKKIRIYSLNSQKYINNSAYNKVLDTFSKGMMLVERNGIQFYIDDSGKEYKSE